MAEKADRIQDTEFTDFVLIGRTGMGKSTTGNKLLGIRDNNTGFQLDVNVTEHTSTIPGLLKLSRSDQLRRSIRLGVRYDRKEQTVTVEQEPQIMFKEGKHGDPNSTTDTCQVLSSDKHGIRVLDVPGFADTRQGNKSGTVYTANLAMIRQLVHIQIDKNLKIRYLVYFMPERGVMEKANGVLQEEIEVLHHFFGMKVFKHMVLVVTRSPFDRSNLPFEKEDIDQTEKVFTTAVQEKVTKIEFSEEFKCPPVIFIDKNDGGEEIRKKFHEVRKPDSQDHLEFKIKSGICSKCSVKTLHAEGDKKIASLLDGKGLIDYDKSKCHPMFIPKHTILTKIIGGTFYMITKMAYLVGGGPEPEFSSFHFFGENCVHCGGSPGAPGCLTVRQSHKIEWQSREMEIYIDHSSELSKVSVEFEETTDHSSDEVSEVVVEEERQPLL